MDRQIGRHHADEQKSGDTETDGWVGRQTDCPRYSTSFYPSTKNRL